MCNIKMYQYSNINETIKFLEKNEDNKKVDLYAYYWDSNTPQY